MSPRRRKRDWSERFDKRLRRGDVDGAAQILDDAPDMPDFTRAAALLLIADRAAERHGQAVARLWYEKALDSADDDVAPQAALSLAQMFVDQGDSESAIAVLRRALLFRGPGAAESALALGSLHLDRCEHEAAREALRFAASLEETDSSASAAVLLGDILSSEGNRWGAELLYQRARDADAPHVEPIAESRLAALRGGGH